MAVSPRRSKRRRTNLSTPTSPSEANAEVEEATAVDTAPPPIAADPSIAAAISVTAASIAGREFQLLSQVVAKITHQTRGENTPLATQNRQSSTPTATTRT